MNIISLSPTIAVGIPNAQTDHTFIFPSCHPFTRSIVNAEQLHSYYVPQGHAVKHAVQAHREPLQAIEDVHPAIEPYRTAKARTKWTSAGNEMLGLAMTSTPWELFRRMRNKRERIGLGSATQNSTSHRRRPFPEGQVFRVRFGRTTRTCGMTWSANFQASTTRQQH